MYSFKLISVQQKKKNMQKLGETMTLSTRITKNILAEKAKLFLR